MMAAKDIAKAFNLIKRGELAAFRQVVAGLNINATHKGFGFLHEACRQRQAEMISEILDREDLDLTLREPATDNPPLVVGVENFVDQELAMRSESLTAYKQCTMMAAPRRCSPAVSKATTWWRSGCW